MTPAREILRAEGADGRVYEVEWTPTTHPRGDRLHVTVTDPTIPHPDFDNRARTLYAEGDSALIWTVEEPEAAIARYEALAATKQWPGVEDAQA